MSTGCEFYADALVERAAHRLDVEGGARLDAHLSACAGCRESLDAILALRAAPVEVPAGLEARIQAAVRQAAPARRHAAPPRRAREWWRPWALPLAAAAALAAVWLGVALPDRGVPGTPEAAAEEWALYGAWPLAEGFVAGEPVLSELSVEELEYLLQEMQT